MTFQRVFIDKQIYVESFNCLLSVCMISGCLLNMTGKETWERKGISYYGYFLLCIAIAKKREEKNQKVIEVLGDNFVCGY